MKKIILFLATIFTFTFLNAQTISLKKSKSSDLVYQNRSRYETKRASKGSKVSLNPHPLPPVAPNKEKVTSEAIKVSKGSKVSLNPQPLPPVAPNKSKINSKKKKT